ncbi:MAG TPA: SAM-dependent methyltransferase, partial [Alcanivorax sp.]|nr:SAM-dependent methyltransferase [Alcanivorax sp.]
SRRTVAHMADMVGELTPEHRVIDLGAGFGGAARFLARNYGCRVTALNLSEVENERDRALNESEGLDHLVEVTDGNFEATPFEDGSFDVVWSQDALLHSGERAAVVREVARLLKPGGVFIFTDPMRTDHCPDGVLQPILDRLHLDTLGSPGFYREQCAANGLEEIGFEDHSRQLPRHYGRVLGETRAREPELRGDISPAYIERMRTGLEHWVAGGDRGHLCWGVFRFRKP